MNGNSNWQDKFSQGFSSTGPDPGALIGVAIFVVLVVVLIVVYQQYQKYKSKAGPAVRKIARPTSQGPAQFTVVPGKINPLQQKIIYDLIDEFRSQEVSSQGVPAAVLEKYSEFFFQNAKRLRTSDREVKEFIGTNYPLRIGTGVELDFHTGDSLHLIKSKTIDVGSKTVSIAFTSPVPDYIRKGAPLFFNYTVGKHFLHGSSSVVEVRAQESLVLKKPIDVTLASERRFARVALKNVSGIIHDPTTNSRAAVRVIDLSLEGLQIQAPKPLDKSQIYQITFEVEVNSKLVVFGPIECVTSKSFVSGSGSLLVGLSFLYLDLNTKTKLQMYVKHLALEMNVNK